MSNLTFKIDSVDVTANVNLGTFRLNFKRNDFNTCSFTIQNYHLIPPTAATTYVVEVLFGATVIFYGYVINSDLEFFAPDVHLTRVSCVADTSPLVSYSTRSFDFSAGDHTEVQILTDIFTGWTPNPITTHVITGDLTAIKWTDASIRRMLDDLADTKSRYWYFDGDRELHWFANTGEVAPFNLSDTPNNTTTFPYGNLKVGIDKAGTDNTTGGSFVCWEDGLRAGMAIGITNSHLSWAAQSFIVNEVEMTVLNNSTGEFEYKVTFGTTQQPRITDYILRGNKVASTASSGLVPALENDESKFLRSDGSWQEASGAAHALDSTTDHSAASDTTDHNASITKHGLLKKLDNDAHHFMGGTGSWSGIDAVASSVGGSRVLGTVYQNTTGHALFVAVCAYLDGHYSLAAFIGATSSPATQVAYDFRNDGTYANSITVYFIVPNGYYYKVTEPTATGALNTWVEWTLG